VVLVHTAGGLCRRTTVRASAHRSVRASGGWARPSRRPPGGVGRLGPDRPAGEGRRGYRCTWPIEVGLLVLVRSPKAVEPPRIGRWTLARPAAPESEPAKWGERAAGWAGSSRPRRRGGRPAAGWGRRWR